MKSFEHQVWCVNGSTGVISRLAGFNNEDAARDYKSQTASAHPQTTVLVVVSGSELSSASVGRMPLVTKG